MLGILKRNERKRKRKNIFVLKKVLGAIKLHHLFVRPVFGEQKTVVFVLSMNNKNNNA